MVLSFLMARGNGVCWVLCKFESTVASHLAQVNSIRTFIQDDWIASNTC